MSRSSTRVLVALGLGLAAFVFLFLGVRRGWPAPSSDSYEYAQVARNVAEGCGIATEAVVVREMAGLGTTDLPAPYLMHDPGTPLVLASLFRILGASNAALAWAGGLCFMVTIAVVQRLGAWLGGEPVG